MSGTRRSPAREFDAGAADYIVKPFSATELVARARAVLRRHADPEVFAVGELAIDYDRRRVTVGDRRVELTATEYELLRVLSLAAGRVSAYDTLMHRVWGRRKNPNPELVRAFVKKAPPTARRPYRHLAGFPQELRGCHSMAIHIERLRGQLLRVAYDHRSFGGRHPHQGRRLPNCHDCRRRPFARRCHEPRRVPYRHRRVAAVPCHRCSCHHPGLLVAHWIVVPNAPRSVVAGLTVSVVARAGSGYGGAAGLLPPHAHTNTMAANTVQNRTAIQCGRPAYPCAAS